MTEMQWVKNYEEALVEFSDLYARMSAPQLAIFATGGGMGLCELTVVPGASGRIAATYHPYDPTSTMKFISDVYGEDKIDFCSANTIGIFLKALKHVCDNRHDLTYVAISSALTTTRPRRGENRAYVAIQTPKDQHPKIWKIALNKHSTTGWEAHFQEREAKDTDIDNPFVYVDRQDQKWVIDMDNLAFQRRDEDQRICRSVMALILDDPTFAHLQEGEKIVSIIDGNEKDPWVEGG